MEFTTLASPPQISAFVADDPDNGDAVFSIGDVLTIEFDHDTNTPDVSDKAAVDALLAFETSGSLIDADYRGVWFGPRRLQLTIADDGGAVPEIDLLKVTVIGDLRAAGGLSIPSLSSRVLTGDWGTAGAPPPILRAPLPAVVDESGPVASFTGPFPYLASTNDAIASGGAIELRLAASGGTFASGSYFAEFSGLGSTKEIDAAIAAEMYFPDAGFSGEGLVQITTLQAGDVFDAQTISVLGCPQAPRQDCRTPSKAKLILRDSTKNKGDRLLWKWQQTDGTLLTDLGVPDLTDPAGFCVYESSTLASGATLLSAVDCAGQPCWKRAPQQVSYNDPTASHGGVRGIKLAVARSGRALVHVDLKGTSMAMPGLPLDQSEGVLAQFSTTSGECWEAAFPGPARKNDAKMFKDILP